MKAAKNLCPAIFRLSRRARRAYSDWISPILHWGLTVECPCCRGRFRGFLPYTGTTAPIPNVECPRCRSHHRHRLLALYLAAHPELLAAERLRVLHLAPEPVVAGLVQATPTVSYVAADIKGPSVHVRVDLAALGFRPSAFDAVIAIHVLEHVPDDVSAMRELQRVLKPGGWAILQVPIDTDRATTYEDPSIMSPKDREHHFGQADHVRLYGLDYLTRLEAGGFTVRIDRFVRDLPPETQRRFGLDPDEDLYLCTKPRKAETDLYASTTPTAVASRLR